VANALNIILDPIREAFEDPKLKDLPGLAYPERIRHHGDVGTDGVGVNQPLPEHKDVDNILKYLTPLGDGKCQSRIEPCHK